MSDTLYVPIEFRADDSRSGPGRLTGVLMTYGEQAGDRREMFDPDSLYWRESGILIREQHRRESPILKTVPIVDGKLIRIDARVPDTQRGRDAITNVREGVFTGLSVEFAAEKVVDRNGMRVIQRAFLDAAGLVDYPSYTNSLVEARAKEWTGRRRLWL